MQFPSGDEFVEVDVLVMEVLVALFVFVELPVSVVDVAELKDAVELDVSEVDVVDVTLLVTKERVALVMVPWVDVALLVLFWLAFPESSSASEHPMAKMNETASKMTLCFMMLNLGE